jgi:hypothetical protein
VGVETVGAPSLRFLQAWGFSPPSANSELPRNLNPHPLKITKGGAPAPDFDPENFGNRRGSPAERDLALMDLHYINYP